MERIGSILLRAGLRSVTRVNTVAYSYVPQSRRAGKDVKDKVIFNRASNLSVDHPIEAEETGCPICSRNITFTYKDVLFLAQFISPEGRLLSRRQTGICQKQENLIKEAVYKSTKLGLLPSKVPEDAGGS